MMTNIPKRQYYKTTINVKAQSGHTHTPKRGKKKKKLVKEMQRVNCSTFLAPDDQNVKAYAEDVNIFLQIFRWRKFS